MADTKPQDDLMTLKQAIEGKGFFDKMADKIHKFEQEHCGQTYKIHVDEPEGGDIKGGDPTENKPKEVEVKYDKKEDLTSKYYASFCCHVRHTVTILSVLSIIVAFVFAMYAFSVGHRMKVRHYDRVHNARLDEVNRELTKNTFMKHRQEIRAGHLRDWEQRLRVQETELRGDRQNFEQEKATFDKEQTQMDEIDVSVEIAVVPENETLFTFIDDVVTGLGMHPTRNDTAEPEEDVLYEEIIVINGVDGAASHLRAKRQTHHQHRQLAHRIVTMRNPKQLLDYAFSRMHHKSVLVLGVVATVASPVPMMTLYGIGSGKPYALVPDLILSGLVNMVLLGTGIWSLVHYFHWKLLLVVVGQYMVANYCFEAKLKCAKWLKLKTTGNSSLCTCGTVETCEEKEDGEDLDSFASKCGVV